MLVQNQEKTIMQRKSNAKTQRSNNVIQMYKHKKAYSIINAKKHTHTVKQYNATAKIRERNNAMKEQK
jgi:hypothetical protein